MRAIVASIVLSWASYSLSSGSDQPYTIIPTTVGDNSIVHAIQQYSNITKEYVNRWKPFGLWIVGPTLRTGAVEAIKNYINVCKSLKLAHYSFPDEKSLKSAFPINWSIGALCAALKNLKDQGINALALIAQVGANSDDVKGLDAVITSYLAIIEHNKNVLKANCAALIKKRAEKKQVAVKLALDKATISEKKAKSWADRFGIVKEIPSLVAIFGAYYFGSKVGTADTSHSSEEK
jgi:hypothetical protein